MSEESTTIGGEEIQSPYAAETERQWRAAMANLDMTEEELHFLVTRGVRPWVMQDALTVLAAFRVGVRVGQGLRNPVMGTLT